MAMRKAGTHMSVAQRRLLLQHVRSDPDLLQAKFRADFTHKDAETRWRKISEQLNQMEGAKKDWKQWRKAWADYRNRIKTLRETRNNIRKRSAAVALTDEEIKTENADSHDIVSIDLKKDEYDEDLGAESDTSYRPPTPQQRSLRKKKNVARDESDLAENRMKYLLERELDIKSSYYERKLVLMERQVLALEKIARATDSAIM